MCTNYSGIMKFLKTSFLFLSLIFLNGCLQSTAMLGPGVTLVTTGNVTQAGFQYVANSAIKNETGKDALTLVKDVVEEAHNKRKFSKDFKKMVEIYEEGRLDLIKKVDLDDVSVNEAYKEAMNIQPKVKLEYDPDRKNWIQHIKDNPEVGKRIVRYANNMFNYKLNYSMKNILGKVFNN